MKNIFSPLRNLAAGLLIGLVATLTIISGTELATYVQKQAAPKQLTSIELFDLGLKETLRQIEIDKQAGRYSYSTTPSSQAAAITDYGENKVVDALLRAQAIGTPATWYIALFTDTCSDSAAGTEVSTSGTAYARQAVTASLANWAGTQSAGSTTASSGTGGTTSNNNAITWSASTAAWGNVQSVGWMDASTAGNRWICINLTAALNVTGAGFTVSFAAAQLSFQIDN